MKRLDAAVVMLEVLDRRRVQAKDSSFGEQLERDLVDSFIRDLDPQPWTRLGLQRFTGRRFLQLISFLAIGVGPYAVLLWLLCSGGW